MKKIKALLEALEGKDIQIPTSRELETTYNLLNELNRTLNGMTEAGILDEFLAYVPHPDVVNNFCDGANAFYQDLKKLKALERP